MEGICMWLKDLLVNGEKVCLIGGFLLCVLCLFVFDFNVCVILRNEDCLVEIGVDFRMDVIFFVVDWYVFVE